MTLLAFDLMQDSSAVPPEASSLLDVSHRQQVGAALNAAILESQAHEQGKPAALNDYPLAS